MIEIRNLSLPLSGGAPFGPAYDDARLRSIVARALGCAPRAIDACAVTRRAVDARQRGDVHFVATVRVRLADARAERDVAAGARGAVVVGDEPAHYEPVAPLGRPVAADERPVVVGAGCAGLFCALALAEAGLAPLLVERGDDPLRRRDVVAAFMGTGALDPECNIQFGAGGAGTFSDGKLTTGTKSPAIPWVTRAFVDAGAPEAILWQAHPHIGSDVLPDVVAALVRRIRRAGGEVRFRTRMSELVVAGGHVAGVRLVTAAAAPDPGAAGAVGAAREEEVAARNVVLACGHSARDVFAMARDRGVALERKPFAMGARIEHAQSAIDRAQYGRAAGHPSLPPAEYKLSWHDASGRGVYTFCMCPGGTVVAAASEPGGVVTNGMSERLRDGRNANAALLVNVLPQDLPGDDVLAGVELQRRCERAAFERGGGGFMAPAQLVGDFLAGTPSSGPGSVAPTYGRGVTWGSLDGTLPPYVLDAMRAGIAPMARRLRGFDAADAVLTGVESRSSSPVRMTRGGDRQSVSTPGLYPCGEGAGYAGGIMSAATDGLATARAVADALRG